MKFARIVCLFADHKEITKTADGIVENEKYWITYCDRCNRVLRKQRQFFFYMDSYYQSLYQRYYDILYSNENSVVTAVTSPNDVRPL